MKSCARLRPKALLEGGHILSPEEIFSFVETKHDKLDPQAKTRYAQVEFALQVGLAIAQRAPVRI